MIIRGDSTISFYAQPSEFPAMAEEAGLQFVRGWQHDDWPGARYNYLFRKDHKALRPAAVTSAHAPA
jgi:hypothetical protein